MMIKIRIFLGTLKNIYSERFFSFDSLLRIVGIITKKIIIGPLKVYVDITSECDMGCVMCWYHSPRLKDLSFGNHIPIEKFKELIMQFKELKVKTVCLCGEGEPFLHPDIKEMIYFIKEQGLETEIITNALYLDKNMADFFKRVRLKKILVSLHSADEEVFQKIHPLKAGEGFRNILDNIYYLRSLYPVQIYLINVMTSLNCDNVFMMVDLANRIKADRILFKPFAATSPLLSSLSMSSQQRNILHKDLINISKNIAIPNNISGYLKILKGMDCKFQRTNYDLHSSNGFCNSKISFCYMPWFSSSIRLDGGVVGCWHARKHIIGDIYQDSFFDLWFSNKYHDFRNGVFCQSLCRGKAVYPLLS